MICIDVIRYPNATFLGIMKHSFKLISLERQMGSLKML